VDTIPLSRKKLSDRGSTQTIGIVTDAGLLCINAGAVEGHV
jgi:hypothetical protein